MEKQQSAVSGLKKIGKVGSMSQWAYAFYLWLNRDLKEYQLFLDLYGSYEPEKVTFEAMIAMAEG